MLPIVDPLLNKSKAEVEVVGKVKEPWPTKNRLQEGRRTVGKSLGLCHLWPSQDVNFYEHFFFAYTVPYTHILCTHMICIYHILYLYISICISKDSFFLKALVHPRVGADLFCTSEEREEMYIFFSICSNTHTHTKSLCIYGYMRRVHE